MKSLSKITFSFMLVAICSQVAIGQSAEEKIKADPKYGDTPEERIKCAQNLSSMKEYMEVDAFDLAYAPWESCYLNCPGSSINIYIYGSRLLKTRAKSAATEQEKNAYIDTLMNLYDKRVEYDFATESFALGKKGSDLLELRSADIKIAYGYLQKAVELGGEDVEERAAVNLMNASNALFQNGQIEADALINDYVAIMEAMEGVLAKAKYKKKVERYMGQIEKIFAESGAANCEALTEIFGPKYAENNTDAELLKKIIGMLDDNGCTDGELYAKASESLYKIEPSAEAAANLANFFINDDLEKAKNYYKEAIELEEDDFAKSGYYYQLARIASKEEDYPLARKNAQEAIALRPDYGDAYILIGNCYAVTKCGETNFQKAAVYLVAVDKFTKAQSVDPLVAEKAGELINQYKKYFPNREDAFFEGYTDGKSYTVGCWINETTTIRTINPK